MIHSFWWKKLSSLHSRLPRQLQEILNGSIPQWLVRGRTTLIQKVKSMGPVPANYRPITCLPTIWKLLTSILSTVVCNFLADNSLLFPEQKGCQKGGKRTLDHLCVDKAILCEVHQ